MNHNVFRVLVTFCQPLDIPAEGSRGSVRGTQVKYLMAGEDLSMLQVQKGTNTALGYQNLKCFLDPDVIRQLPAAPAFYDCEFRMKAGSDGKLVSVPVSFTYVADAVFSLGMGFPSDPAGSDAVPADPVSGKPSDDSGKSSGKGK